MSRSYGDRADNGDKNVSPKKKVELLKREVARLRKEIIRLTQELEEYRNANEEAADKQKAHKVKSAIDLKCDGCGSENVIETKLEVRGSMKCYVSCGDCRRRKLRK